MKITKVDLDDYHRVVENFQRESDRAAAVLAGSYLENHLAIFMQRSMVDDQDKDKWFDGFGPFSTYDQRVVASYAFRLIPKPTKRDFQLIGKIRNYFAHQPKDASFNDSPVVDWVNELNYPKTNIEELKPSNRDKYLLTISMAVVAMHNAMTRHSEQIARDAAPPKP